MIRALLIVFNPVTLLVGVAVLSAVRSRLGNARRGFHVSVRDGKSRDGANGRTLRATAYGIKVGYWPCFRAPYIEIAWSTKRYAVWYGLANYEEAAAAGVVSCDLRIAA